MAASRQRRKSNRRRWRSGQRRAGRAADGFRGAGGRHGGQAYRRSRGDNNMAILCHVGITIAAHDIHAISLASCFNILYLRCASRRRRICTLCLCGFWASLRSASSLPATNVKRVCNLGAAARRAACCASFLPPRRLRYRVRACIYAAYGLRAK